MSPSRARKTRVKWSMSLQLPWIRSLLRWPRNPGGAFVSSNTSRSPYGNSCSKAGISSSVRLHSTEQTMEPAEAPEMMRGSSWASNMAFTTPICIIPNVPPPLNSKALRPKLCRAYSMPSRRSWCSVPAGSAPA